MKVLTLALHQTHYRQQPLHVFTCSGCEKSCFLHSTMVGFLDSLQNKSILTLAWDASLLPHTLAWDASLLSTEDSHAPNPLRLLTSLEPAQISCWWVTMLPGNPSPGSFFTKRISQSNPVNEIKIKTKPKRKQIETTQRNLYRTEANRARENRITTKGGASGDDFLCCWGQALLATACGCRQEQAAGRRSSGGADGGGWAPTGVVGRWRSWMGANRGGPPDEYGGVRDEVGGGWKSRMIPFFH
jgi:hypothetical protein